MAETGVLCPSCGTDVGQGNPAYCPSCRSPLLGQRPTDDRPLADPFGDWPDAGAAHHVAPPVSHAPEPALEPVAPADTAPPTTPRRSRRWVGVLIALAVIALIRVGWGAVSGPERDSEGAVVEAGATSAFDIRVGDCFSLPDDTVVSIEEAQLVPCAEPHTYEAYAAYVYPDKAQAPYPGLDPIFAQAGDYCLEEFEAFVDHRWETSVLDFAYLYPEEEGWQQVGDRTVLCLIQPTGSTPLEGTMRGAGI